jgi:amphi-Trp domain-containing protein
MTEFDDEEQVSPHEAAEYLVDIAYGLTGGEAIDLRRGAERVRVPVGDRVLVKRTSTRKGERVELAIELRWTA